MFGASSELASVMEFGFYRATHGLCGQRRIYSAWTKANDRVLWRRIIDNTVTLSQWHATEEEFA